MIVTMGETNPVRNETGGEPDWHPALTELQIGRQYPGIAPVRTAQQCRHEPFLAYVLIKLLYRLDRWVNKNNLGIARIIHCYLS
jgi:hypothetical protein